MLLEPSTRFSPDFAAGALNERYENAPAAEVLSAGLRLYAGEIAVVSSFGAESAVLLHMVAEIDRHVPVLMVDTLMLFEETLDYQERLARDLGLTDVRRIVPDDAELEARDRYGALHMADPDACCALRKVAPLERALAPFRATVSGRKRHQTATRAAMALWEPDVDRMKVNPLAEWRAKDVRDYAARHRLPAHPLVTKGFLSIGCKPCTTAVEADEDPRAGRWRGTAKDECGIHFGADGRAVRRTA